MSSSNNKIKEGFNNLLFLSPPKKNFYFKEKNSETCSNSKTPNSNQTISPFNSENSKYQCFISSELMNQLNEISPIQIKNNYQNNFKSIENETNYLLDFYEDKNKKYNFGGNNFLNFFPKPSFIKKLNFNENYNFYNNIDYSFVPNVDNICKKFDEICKNDFERKIFSKKNHKIDKLKKNKKEQKNYFERKGDWECFNCQNMNFGYRKYCNQCNFDKNKSDKLFEEKKLKMHKIIN